MCVNTYVYVCVYICVCICMCVYMNMYIYMYIYTCIHVYVYIYIYIYMYVKCNFSGQCNFNYQNEIGDQFHPDINHLGINVARTPINKGLSFPDSESDKQLVGCNNGGGDGNFSKENWSIQNCILTPKLLFLCFLQYQCGILETQELFPRT